MRSCHILIIGAGITGLTIARELLHHGVDDILIIEKEDQVGAHASGRNSGVLHAGIYYTQNSLKARYCVDGNQRMKAYCREKGLTLLENGKVIIPRLPEEIESLIKLKERADASGARTSIVNGAELMEIEPYAAIVDQALYSPDTAAIRPLEILNSLAQDLERTGQATLLFDTSFLGLEGDKLARTSGGDIAFELLINAAGVYAERIAHMFELGREYCIVPFKGAYKQIRRSRSNLVRGSIYPVPDLRNPFLGVHFTRSADDVVYIGPNASPAFGRENYGLFDGLNTETPLIALRDTLLLILNPGFRSAAVSEPKMMFKRFLLAQARKLLPELQMGDIEESRKVGIRAQLVHWPTKKLVTDFVMLQDERSLHILNAISPAFTSSMSFARYAVQTFLEEKE